MCLLCEGACDKSFVDRMKAKTEAFAVGRPTELGTKMGALASCPHRGRVESMVNIARKEGGDIIVGGRRPDADALVNGR